MLTNLLNPSKQNGIQMSTEPLNKNKGGRPPRARGEKLQRINLSLRPGVLFGLELLARDRDESLSQAVEFTFNVVARDYKVRGEPLSRLAEYVGTLEHEGPPNVELYAHDGKIHSAAEQKEILAKFLRDTGLGKIQMMPEGLRRADERFFYEVFSIDGPGYWTEGELFAELARKGFTEGLSPRDVAAEWRRLAREKIGPAIAKTKAKKKSKRKT